MGPNVEEAAISPNLLKLVLLLQDVDRGDRGPPPGAVGVGREEGEVGVALDVAAVGVASANFEGLLQAVAQDHSRALDRYFKLGQDAFRDGEGGFNDTAGLLQVSLDLPDAQGGLVSQGKGHLSEAILKFNVCPL